MSRVPARLSRVRTIPWMLVLRTGQVIWMHLRDDLSPHDRRRLGALLKTPPHRLTAQERSDLRAIVRKVDVAGLGRDLAGLRGLRR
jgi:hypothetical protein